MSTTITTMYSQPQLPSQFANQLLDCEIQLELNPHQISPQIIMKLVQLYRIGTEYYESIRSYKYLYFQRKMNNIVKSDKILNSLNNNNQKHITQQQKPNIIIIQSLTDFKKQQVTLVNPSQKQQPIINTPQGKKSSHPFKRHLQQKFQSKQYQRIIQNPQIIKQKQQRQNQLKLLAKLQHKQKQQQLNQKLNVFQPDKQMKKFIDNQTKKIQQISSIIGKVVQNQQDQFKKKLEERRERIKSNTEKRRMTKSFSDNADYWANNNLSKTNQKNIQTVSNNALKQENCQSPINNHNTQSKAKRNIPSTKLFSSFIQSKNEENFDDFEFQQVTINSNLK